MVRWFDRQAREIHDAPALRIYAVLIATVHALTGAAWFSYKHIASLASGDDCVCWPLWSECYRLRPLLTPALVTGAVAVYVAIGLGSAALLAWGRCRAGLLTFALAGILGTAIYALDYRLRFNQTTMFAWVALTLVFARHRLVVLQALLVAFYAWAGTLKLDPEWLSGAALYGKPLFVPAGFEAAACTYVVVLELGLIPLLFLVRSAGWRWAIYVQILCFHLASWPVVGWFYPVLMALLTAIFPLVWRLAPEDSLAVARLRLGASSAERAADGNARATTFAVVGSFSFFQVVPWFFPGDTAITGEGRMFALHMFDARVECRGEAILRDATPAATPHARVLLVNDRLDARTRCDPLVIASTAQRLCRALAEKGDDSRVDVVATAKRATHSNLRPLITQPDFCKAGLRYSIFHHNAWIRTK